MREPTPPRIFCLPATAAPVVAVLRRGPADWSHVGRWDLRRRVYEPGAWLRGRVFPRRCDLSPDGRWLCYFAHKPGATWEHGDTYIAVSKLPWLTALHASGANGTWTRGSQFIEGRDASREGPALPIPYRLAPTRTAQFAAERRRGWVESPDSPPRDPKDLWDQRRNARLERPQPGGDRTLHVESVGLAGGEFGVEQAVDGLRVRYAIADGDDIELLDDLQWADWDAEGRLLVATRDGRIQIRELRDGLARVVFEVDLNAFTPDPQPAPAEARRW